MLFSLHSGIFSLITFSIGAAMYFCKKIMYAGIKHNAMSNDKSSLLIIRGKTYGV